MTDPFPADARLAKADIAVDIGIIGAGPVGGALACRLAAEGVRVAIVDRAALPPMEHPDFDGRAYAVAAGAQALLAAAGLWQRLPYPAGPIRDIRVSDGRVGRPASPLHLHFSARDAGQVRHQTFDFCDTFFVEPQIHVAVGKIIA